MGDLVVGGERPRAFSVWLDLQHFGVLVKADRRSPNP
jgi:hypothetical protein